MFAVFLYLSCAVVFHGLVFAVIFADVCSQGILYNVREVFAKINLFCLYMTAV